MNWILGTARLHHWSKDRSLRFLNEVLSHAKSEAVYVDTSPLYGLGYTNSLLIPWVSGNCNVRVVIKIGYRPLLKGFTFSAIFRRCFCGFFGALNLSEALRINDPQDLVNQANDLVRAFGLSQVCCILLHNPSSIQCAESVVSELKRLYPNLPIGVGLSRKCFHTFRQCIDVFDVIQLSISDLDSAPSLLENKRSLQVYGLSDSKELKSLKHKFNGLTPLISSRKLDHLFEYVEKQT